MNKILLSRCIIFISLFVLILISGLELQKNYSNTLLVIATLGTTSAIYLSLYFGLKGFVYRSKIDNKISRHIEKVHISYKEIIIHICIVISSAIFMKNDKYIHLWQDSYDL